MKYFILFLVSLFAILGCNKQATQEEYNRPTKSNKSAQTSYLIDRDTFKLSYFYAGLGSGLGSMQPTFRVVGTDYYYNLEQNSSYTGEIEMKPQLICKGKLREASIDSIINLVKDMNDTLIYNTNINIMSGGIHSITVKYKKIAVTFRLHNASDATAQKIVDILNTNIPIDKDKLWLF